jgi:murein DD-endopeptidase MepM/ murein hydrolase activator NlpD
MSMDRGYVPDRVGVQVLCQDMNDESNARRSLPKGICLFLGLCLGLSLACNFPAATSLPEGLTGAQLRQTMEALRVTLTPQPPLSQTPPTASQPSTPLFAGLETSTPGAPQDVGVPPSTPVDGQPVRTYIAQSGDTLSAVARRFEVEPDEISSPQPLPSEGYLTPGQTVSFPDPWGPVRFPGALLPDGEVIYSPSAGEFDVSAFVKAIGGFLQAYGEEVDGEWQTGAEIVERVALETSTNPRLLLSILEYRSGWLLSPPEAEVETAHPIGFNVAGYQGLYKELLLSANHLNIGYYDWRVGALSFITFRDRSQLRLSPALNPGSIALQNLFSKLYDQPDWVEALYGRDNFVQRHQIIFGDPWERAAPHAPLLTPTLSQPTLELPFAPGSRWSFTGGPHRTLTRGSPLGALDFAPTSGEPVCAVSSAWVTASAPGRVTRSDSQGVAIDLDGDGNEGTGWVLFYLHLASVDRLPAGAVVATDDRIGHPSCEGGNTTGTHVHIARKYNGEWLAADGPVPFILSGWRARAGDRLYEGYLTRDGQEVWANPGGSRTSIIIR